jgi:hypothetical protein
MRVSGTNRRRPKLFFFSLDVQQKQAIALHHTKETIARIYKPGIRETKPETLVISH